MKRILFPFVLLLLVFSSLSYGQMKIGYVDSDAIMDKLPDAQDARQKLDVLVQEWQGELNKIENTWKTKYDDYEKRKLIMTDQAPPLIRHEIDLSLSTFVFHNHHIWSSMYFRFYLILPAIPAPKHPVFAWHPEHRVIYPLWHQNRHNRFSSAHRIS